jgi:hypothetical protein
MSDFIQSSGLRRHSDRRTGVERRHFSYSYYIPERRGMEDKEPKDRRNGMDRRANNKPLKPSDVIFN